MPSGTGRSFSSGGRLRFGGVRGEYSDKELSELEEDEADSMESCRRAYGLQKSGDIGGVGEDVEEDAYEYVYSLSSSQRRETRRPDEVVIAQ